MFDFASKHMPRDAPGSLPEGDYWAIVGFDAPLGPDNAGSVELHAEKAGGAAPAGSESESRGPRRSRH